MTHVSIQSRSDQGTFLPRRTVSVIDHPRVVPDVKVRPPELASIFALRTTSAALLGFSASWSFGIHHPWWAAMTVWLVAQPTRGLLLERGLARLLGTVCGALAGVGILDLAAGDRLTALVAVAAWLALCAGLGSIFRHFRNYGFVLAGYTASIIVLFGLGEGGANPDLALDRVICTAIGIVCSAVLSFRVLPDYREALARKREDVLDHCLGHVEAALDGREADLPNHVLLSDIAALDRGVDDYAAGSMHRQREARYTRRLSGLLLELIALAEASRPANSATGIREAGRPIEQRLAKLMAAADAADQPSLAETLDELRRLLAEADASPSTVGPQPVAFDIDPASVWRAAVRPVIAVAIAAVVWWASGWASGAMMVVTAALFTSLFSSHAQGNDMIVQVLLGTLAGAAAGTLARLVLLPHAYSLPVTLLCIAPFLLAGAWLMRRPATSKMAIDLIMTFLLVAQPSAPPVDVALVFNQAAAIIVGVVIAVTTFWAVLPATPAVRSLLLARRIVRLTRRLANSHDAISAAAIRQHLRSAVARLLDFTQPDLAQSQGAVFRAAQACLAAASLAVTARSKDAGPNPASPSTTPSTTTFDFAATQAADALSATLQKTNKREIA
ncbi:fusaric acid resistance protein [Novosphingobium sp. Rr 2-17]|uniref:FUSC family protein n=1 Tax=Novosphingobium sp. Rr 2-17 TaxID=555793 RepID=UPI00026988FB|nr:FUSC family protein [Novosphingobium sp. Rr 2-17]EIZ77619.1 fusaric acid resistance protein [Novosphingobium sp. Rr 2-17]